MSETIVVNTGDIGKKIKLFLVENDISQTTIAKQMKCSDSVLSDKLNGKVKLPAGEFFTILKRSVPNTINTFRYCNC